ncbi:sigma-54-dependent Fis family transcriptional regulator [Marinobacter salinisoli]|uniref:Sigma-54-dependent Fis family transcriptional regulator n=1 Tax=Marinobacter salinisoli TaxID=2769486 RepID=A0ABX7MP65_9GAMM|nr:sigma-54 dependent transcriptional regulator [Marinobacter salinisoli]QSP93968.1 sigma-54-dependent Fis family transcriptional regulator [Marinobacter salinisoli]
MPNDSRPRVLLVEDSPSNALVYRSYLEQDYEVEVVHTGHDALQSLSATSFNALVTDVRLPDMSGLDILDRMQKEQPALPVVVITGHGSVDMVVDAMQRGASDFISKPFDKARLCVTLANILKEQKLKAVVEEYEKTFVREQFHKMIGASLPMQNVYRIIESASKSRASVFITGESGTGKELCSEALHAESNRSDKPFVAINCAAIPRELIESEIFGHVKGAFTGASAAREGAALRASGGTLFLDEIGEMPLDLQSKLLRLIQSGTFQPVGSSKELKVDVRFICATNRDPLLEVQEGRFREDLYYRLHVIPIHMPALRERGNDIMLIAHSLLLQYAKDEHKAFESFSPDVEQFFMQHSWPGNVRELSNVIRNVVVLHDGKIVEMSMLPDLRAASAGLPRQPGSEIPGVSKELPPSQQQPSGPKTGDNTRSELKAIIPLWLEEKRIIESAIEKCGGNVPKAAAFLEISPSTIYRKKQQWEKMDSLRASV